MNYISSFLNHSINDELKDTLILSPGTACKNSVHNFRSPKDNSIAQLVISKKENLNQVYSVLIRFLETKNNICAWEISVSKDDQIRNRIAAYSGSRSFSFKVEQGGYVKIKDYVADAPSVKYVDLFSYYFSLKETLPSLEIRTLINAARAIPTTEYTQIHYNQTVVIFVIIKVDFDRYKEEHEIYIGDIHSLQMQKCEFEYTTGSELGTLRVKVQYEGKEHLLHLQSFIDAGGPKVDTKWDGEDLWGGD
jgi:hypothetical protein